MNFQLLDTLCGIHAPSGNEVAMKDFLLNYIQVQSRNWKVKPEIVKGEEFQDCVILKFGEPRTAIFAHMDSIGFTVRYQDQLVPIGVQKLRLAIDLSEKTNLAQLIVS